MGTYLDQIKKSNPDAYNKLVDLAKYTANENYNGNAQDWQAQIFTGLDTAKFNAPKTVEPAYNGVDEQGWPVYTAPPPVLVGNSNGLNIYAYYDASGRLTGYKSDAGQRNWLSGNQSVSGAWDTEGKPVPIQYSSGGGGFFGGITSDLSNIWDSIGPIGQIAALYYGGSALADAYGAAEAAPALDVATQDAMASYAPQIGPGVQVASTEAGAGLNEAANAYAAGGANAAQGLQMPASANLAEMGGAQGIGGGTTLAGLADMGGAQGLTTAAGAGLGSMLGEAGVGGAITPTTAGIGAGLGLGAANAAADTNAALAAAGVGSGAANALTGAATGTALADILPYTAGAQVVGSLLQANAAKSGADAQTAAAQAAIAQQQKNFDTINAQQAPYRAAGYGALNKIANLGGGGTQQYDASGNVTGTTTNPSDYLTHQFNAADLTAGLAPNYDFMLQQGQMSNQRAANVGGGSLGGNALQGLNKFTQDYAGNAYQNAFNNYQTQRGNIYNTLANIAGIGQTGQNATNTAATNATNAATQLGVGSAAAQAAGTTGSANAYTNAINNATNQYTLASLLNQRGNVTMPTA